MDFDDKVSRADIRYIPKVREMTEVMSQTISSPEDRELTANILENYIDE